MIGIGALKTLRIPLLLFTLYVVFMTPMMGRKKGYTVDATPSFQITQSIVENGQLFPDEKVKQGYIYSIVYLPFYKIAQWLSPLFPGLEQGWVERKSMCWMNTVTTACTVGLMARLLKVLHFSVKSQIIVPLLYGFTTLAFCYARYDYNKCLATFLLLFSFYGYVRLVHQQKISGALYWSVAMGLLAMLRLEMMIVIPVYVWGFWRIGIKDYLTWRHGLLLSLPIIFGILFVFLYNVYYWKGSLAGGYEGQLNFNPFTAFVGFILSPGKNIWLFNPILILVPVGIPWFLRKDGPAFKVGMGIIGVLFLFYCFWGNWWGGWGYGPRHLVPLLPLAVLPLAAVIDDGSMRHIWMLFFLGIFGFAVQLLGSAIDFNDVILTLMRAGIDEEALIWAPILNPVFQHAHFLMNISLTRWDWGWFGLYENISFETWCVWFIVWIFCLFLLVYCLWREFNRNEGK